MNLAHVAPEERARAAWVRLREASIKPDAVLAVWLAVKTTAAAHIRGSFKREREYVRIQETKVLHRAASGTHLRW